jgi:hypothetical protein
MKQALFALCVACLLAGCGSTTPTAPAASPVAEVDASPVVTSVQAPPSSSEPAPSASTAPEPSPTPDPAAIRTAAAAAFQAAGVANWQALHGVPAKDIGSDAAAVWAQYAAALKQLRVPADTAADLNRLIGKVTRLEALLRQQSAAFAPGTMHRFYKVAGQRSRTESDVEDTATRVRTDLGLPLRPFHMPDPYTPDFSYP